MTSSSVQEALLRVMMGKAAAKADNRLVPDDFPDKHKDTIESIRTCPFSKLEAYVFIDESDMSEWTVYGIGVIHDHHYDVEWQRDHIPTAKVTVEKETGLIATDRIVTLKSGDPIQYTRRMKRPNVTHMEALFGAPTHHYLAKL